MQNTQNNAKPLVKEGDIKLAILGLTPGNGHPYSWSAIFNGYDEPLMSAECPYPGIPEYLNKQPKGTLGIPGAKITHICCTGTGEFEAEHVARCSLIPHIVDKPEDVIGKVDAVIIATDVGSEHVARARPFVEAGIPVFIDKPLVDNARDLAIFNAWVAGGKPIMSGSSMRYSKEYLPYQASTWNLGKLRFVSVVCAKKWETYGIHALEGAYSIIGPGFISCRNTGDENRNVAHFKHQNGVDLVVSVIKDMFGGFGLLTLVGTKDYACLMPKDSYYSFKTQLVNFVSYLRTGVRPFPYSETEELMRMVIAGGLSREAGGKEIFLKDVL